MPKEVIRNRPELDDGAGPYMRVGWSKDPELSGHVELGVVGPDSDYKLMRHMATEEGSSGWVEVGTDGAAGLFVQLDRTGINRAIRILRKARDDAYGRDE